ncbi:MAG: phosphatidate cytidylyltransferase [Cyanobacteria bacterium HKST-UBA06]|nr:phosphatidate cytidylyltransferase [Cyanobacteria bacterium HKST-UBA06]
MATTPESSAQVTGASGCSGSGPSHFKHRILPGFTVMAINTLMLVLGGVWWVALLYGYFLLMQGEMMGMLKTKQMVPSRTAVILVGSGFYLLAWLGQPHYFSELVALGVMVTCMAQLFRVRRASIHDIGATVLTYFYLGFLPAHLVMLRQIGCQGDLLGLCGGTPFFQQPGCLFTFWVILANVATDVGAYYAGKRFGKTLLLSAISPSKTWEGAIGGLLAGVGSATGFSILVGLPLVHGVALGALVSVVSQMGDLFESLLKRDAGLKDSGNVLAGHGGFMDRFDGYIFSGAVAYYYIVWFMLHQGLALDVLNWWRTSVHVG